MTKKKVVVAGATGLVGNAALRHFGRANSCEIIAVSRRKPRNLYGARHVQVDLTDPAQCTLCRGIVAGHNPSCLRRAL